MRRHFRPKLSPLNSVAVRYRHPLVWRSSGQVAHHRAGRFRVSAWGPDTRLESSILPGKDDRLARLEAVLLIAKEPLHPRKLSKFAKLDDGTEALTLVSRLNDLYDQSARAFRAEEVAGGWQLRTRPQFGSWLRRLRHIPPAVRLSAPAMETLAVVAYRQPVVRADVEEVRGVACGELLRQLMERDLVKVVGRSEELGRPYLYGTTKRFLKVFGLNTLDELPRANEFRQSLTTESDSETNSTSKTVEPIDEQTTGEGDDKVTVAMVIDPASQADETVRGPIVPGSGLDATSVPRPIRAEDDDWEDEYEDDDDEEEEEDDDYEYVDDDEEWIEDDDELADDELADDEEWVEDDEELDDDEEWVEVDDDEEEYDDDEYIEESIWRLLICEFVARVRI